MSTFYGNGAPAYPDNGISKIPRRDVPSKRGTGSLTMPSIPGPDARIDMARGGGDPGMGMLNGLSMSGSLRGQGPTSTRSSASDRLLPFGSASSNLNQSAISNAKNVLSQGNFGLQFLDTSQLNGFDSDLPMSTHFNDGWNVTSGDMILKSTDGQSELPNSNDICFVRISNGRTKAQVKRSHDGTQYVYPVVYAFTLAALNKHLAERQIAAVEALNDVGPSELTLDDINLGPKDKYDGLHYLDAKSIWANFAPFGVVNTAPTTTGNYMNAIRDPSSRALSGAEQRNAGIVMGGLAHTKNMWRRKLPVGTNLYFAIKPMKMPKRYMTNTVANANASASINSEISTEKAQRALGDMVHPRVERPYQFVPIYSLRAEPPYEDIKHKNAMGQLTYAPYYRFGQTYKSTDSGPIKFSPDEAARNLKYTRDQSNIRINLGIRF